jgi:hypothetical protein
MSGLAHVVAIVALAGASGAADDDRVARAKAAADASSQALVKGDFELVADLTYPTVVDQLGRKRMIDLLADGQKKMAADGYRFISASVGDPHSLTETPTGLLIIVPTTILMTVPGGRMTQESFLVGASNDNGKSWTFVDGANLNATNAKQVFPDFPSTLTLPVRKPPAFDPD